MQMHHGLSLIATKGYEEWLKEIDTEIEAMVCCVCRWPNFAPGVCMLCGRKERQSFPY